MYQLQAWIGFQVASDPMKLQHWHVKKVASSQPARQVEQRRASQRYMHLLSYQLSGATRELLLPQLERMARSRYGIERVCLDRQLFKEASEYTELSGVHRMKLSSIAVTRISPSYLHFQVISRFSGRHMTEWCQDATGTQEITSSSPVERTASKECATSMADSSTVHPPTSTG